MRKTRTPAVSEAVLATWRQRVQSLRRQLAESASDERAWLWQLQYHILSWLLARYGGEEVEPLPPGPQRAVPVTEPELRAAFPSGSRPISVPSGMGKAPRSAKELRSALGQIGQINRRRYEACEREIEAHRKAMELEMKRLRGRHAQLVAARIEWLSWIATSKGEREESAALRQLLSQMLDSIDPDSPDLEALCRKLERWTQ